MDQQLIGRFQSIVGSGNLRFRREELLTYDADASMLEAHLPQLVALPRDTAQVAALFAAASAAGLPVVPRGAGTGISGGATPVRGGLVIGSSRMQDIQTVLPADRLALVQSGVINAELSAEVAGLGYQFAPDPSSQRACSIGGNIANNSGGPHCLKYGTTTNHVLALELVLPDGSTIWTADAVFDQPGYDLTGLVNGSEGTFGFVTRAWVRLTRLPEQNRVVLALFPTIVAATAAVSAIIAAGSLPTSLEVMDQNAIRAVNQAYGLGLPADAGALLIVEVDGVADGLDALLEQILQICRQYAAFELRPARSSAEQAQVWRARKAVAGAIGRLAPAYYLVDTVVPRTRMPELIEQVEQLRQRYAMQVCNVFHAGDGNLHPLVLYDPRDPDQLRRAQAIAVEVLKLSIAAGGVISGEHGIGLEKQEYLPLLFSQADLQAMACVHQVFNPHDQANPAKIFPLATPPGLLAEQRGKRITSSSGTLALPELLPALERALGAAPRQVPNAAEWPAGLTGTLLAPQSQAELQQTLLLCHRAGARVFPLGGGTQLPAQISFSTAAEPAPLMIVSTTALKRVLEYEPDDLTITVEAGITLAELQQLLAQRRQMLPLDVPFPERATLGGLVAAAADGPRRLGYGSLRDLLLGITLIEVDGTASHSGGRVVKNVSGFDLPKLYLGSYGSLGVIAALSLRVLPMPAAEATLLAGFERRSSALAFLAALRSSFLTPSAVEYTEDMRASAAACVVALRAEGHAAAVARHLREARELAQAQAAQSLQELHGAEHDLFWQQQAAWPARTGDTLLKLSLRPSELGELLEQLDLLAQRHELQYRVSARALSGIVYLRLTRPGSALAMLQQALIARWRWSRILAAEQQSLTGLPIWGATPPGMALCQALKQGFDPAGRLPAVPA